ncbi:hypothetical protein ACODT3_10545 [Streptomyces sp. 4.24]|uniref:hypothetical protein n=1 Tax=Streptomyces tritrimontium TaxID=3406573 RepID=UPI003BB58C9A
MQLLQKIARLERAVTRAKFTAITYATEAAELQEQLDVAGITISGLLHDLKQERAARKTADQEGIRLKAALDNATSISVAVGSRDIADDDQPTHPTGTDVRPLWAALGIVPGNTSPSHVPAVTG